MNLTELRSVRDICVRELIRLYYKSNAGHIGASLSCIELLVYVFFHKMRGEDRFVLSKGHAALALYIVLFIQGKITKEQLESYYKNGTILAAHPPCNRKLNGVHFGTGSLGHGLSIAAGFDLANRFTKADRKVFCILSEGDCDEGSTWEAALFAGHHRLSNLFVMIDNNNLQGFGDTSSVLDLEPFTEKWRSFNFEVAVAGEGNEFESIDKAYLSLEKATSDKPKCLIAKTVKGNGISFMENKLEWHYLPLNQELFDQALLELNRTKNA